MSIIDTLVTDRVASDVGQNDKGSYNYTDLNRVGSACIYLHDLLGNYGYSPSEYIELRTNWTETDVPTVSDMEAYIRTLTSLQSALLSAQEIPTSMNRLTYGGANNIEKLLVLISDEISRMIQIFIYSGMVYSGQIWDQFV